MKRFIILALFFSVAASGVFLWQARAQETTPMTEAHIARIRANCVEAQSTLGQLHASDALLRVNRGRLYESISTQLMVPLNSRISISQLDGVKLVAISTTYESQLASFRSNYKLYEEAMSQTLRINCTNEPVAFYDQVNDTRNKRKKVHENTLSLHKTIGEYQAAFETFATKFKGDTE